MAVTGGFVPCRSTGPTARRGRRRSFVAGMLATRRFVALALSAATVFTMVGIGTARADQHDAASAHSQPLHSTTPFQGSSTEVNDNEGSARRGGRRSLDGVRQRRRAVRGRPHDRCAAPEGGTGGIHQRASRFGGGGTAGQARTEDLEALAYDANADAIYAFSGSTSATPTAFRLTWTPTTSSRSSPGSRCRRSGLRRVRAADGRTYVANDATIRTYDFVTNTLGPSFSISGLTKVFGLDFDDVTGDLLAVNNKQSLYRASMTTRTLLTGWNGISLTSFGLLDTRAVEVIGEQVLVTDGADSNLRPHTDPMSHAVFVLDVSGPAGPAPTASFTATPTAGSVPLAVNFTDTSTGGPTSWAWDFGDGGTSTAQSPSHTYTSTGTFTARLTATNGQGSTSTTRAITVTQPTAPTASFTATPTAGSVPLAVNFTDTSTGGPTSWAWDLGTAARRPRNRRRTPTPAPGRSPPD